MDEDEGTDIADYRPVHTNTFRIPNDHNLLIAYHIYKPTVNIIKIKSEKGRTVFAEAFIENNRLGTLEDLCVEALAKKGEPQEPLLVSGDPLKLAMHYESLSVDLPLEKCYQIDNDEYWHRVVLAKTDDKTLQFKKTFNWKELGISLKFVELVEACPAEYWPEEEMDAIIVKIKDYVTSMHIRKLKPMNERHFEALLEDVADDEASELSYESISTESSLPELVFEEIEDGEQLTDEQIAERTAKIAEHEAAKEAKRKAYEARLERRRIREEKKKKDTEPVEVVKKKRKKRPKGFFDIPVEPPEEDSEADKVDRRNIEKLMHKIKTNTYPPEHCHHVDLSFLRFFDRLVSLTIEFLGPDQHRNYQTKFFNFSYKDMENLAAGLQPLKELKTFRLSNSRMDARKLDIIVQSLKILPSLETIDFSCDQLQDDCGETIFELFQHLKTLKFLELRGNSINIEVMQKLGDGLSQYQGRLEYLGLAGNMLDDEALHALSVALLGTEQVKHLCLTGVSLSQRAIRCCIANELLREHSPLKQLDLIAVYISFRAGVDILNALIENRDILYMDCRGCELDYDLEFEIEVLLKRNRYIAGNPYIGDETKTEEEVTEFLNRSKNPLMLKALKNVESSVECLTQRTNLIPGISECYKLEEEVDEAHASEESETDTKLPRISVKSYYSEMGSMESLDDTPFQYDPNNFTEAKYKKHVYHPGPSDRFYYFQEIKQRHLFKDHSKD